MPLTAFDLLQRDFYDNNIFAKLTEFYDTFLQYDVVSEALCIDPQ